MGIWQQQLGSWARWWNTQIKVNQPRFTSRWDTLYIPAFLATWSSFHRDPTLTSHFCQIYAQHVLECFFTFSAGFSVVTDQCLHFQTRLVSCFQSRLDCPTGLGGLESRFASRLSTSRQDWSFRCREKHRWSVSSRVKY